MIHNSHTVETAPSPPGRLHEVVRPHGGLLLGREQERSPDTCFRWMNLESTMLSEGEEPDTNGRVCDLIDKTGPGQEAG